MPQSFRVTFTNSNSYSVSSLHKVKTGFQLSLQSGFTPCSSSNLYCSHMRDFIPLYLPWCIKIPKGNFTNIAFLSFFPPPIWLGSGHQSCSLEPRNGSFWLRMAELLQLPGLLNEREMKFSFTETSGFWVSLLYQLSYNLTKRPICALKYSGWHLPTKPRSTPWRLDRAACLFKLWLLGKLRNGIHCSSWENTPSTSSPLNVLLLLLIV